MACRFVFFMSLLTIAWAGIASGEWTRQERFNAKPQSFTAPADADYVIAIGTEDKLEPVQAEQINAALLAGKEIRLERVEIMGDIDFHDEIKQDVYFRGATFSGNAYFMAATFSGEAEFSFAAFSGNAYFSFATFSKDAEFSFAAFSGNAGFREATFSGEANFRSATFKERADFPNCRFKDLSHFVGCLYLANTEMNFSGVTGFSQMQFEWVYAPQWDNEWETAESETKNNHDRKRRGLRGHLKYDKTFYIALIKNYQDMGWLDEADDCYYTYRVGKREQANTDQKSENFGKPLNSWHNRAIEYTILDFPFGYGVKPWKIVRSFLILWLPFSWFYVFFLRHQEKGTSPWSTAPFTHHEFWGFVWGFMHGLNTITPGIDLDSLTAPYLKESPYIFDVKSKWVFRVQVTQRVLGWYLFTLFIILFGKIWIR